MKLARGAAQFVRGVGFLLQHPRLIPWVLAPALLTAIVMALLVTTLVVYSREVSEWILPDSGLWLQILTVVIFLLFWFVGFGTITSLIAIPFSDYLSNRVELLTRGGSPVSTFRVFVREIGRAFAVTAFRITVFLTLVVGLSPLLLLPPPFSIFYSVVVFILGAAFLAWDGVDFCLGRRDFSVWARLKFLRRHSSALLGFGSVAALFLLIPLTSLFVLPINAVGGTLLFLELEEKSSANR